MGSPFIPNKTERSKTTFPLKEKTDFLILVCMSHPSECVCPTRAMREARSELCERLVPSYARGSFRAMREARSERCERLVPSDARGSFRAIRKVRSERCERFAPSDARGSFRVIRMVRAGRREAFPLFVGSG